MQFVHCTTFHSAHFILTGMSIDCVYTSGLSSSVFTMLPTSRPVAWTSFSLCLWVSTLQWTVLERSKKTLMFKWYLMVTSIHLCLWLLLLQGKERELKSARWWFSSIIMVVLLMLTRLTLKMLMLTMIMLMLMTEVQAPDIKWSARSTSLVAD